MFLDKKSVLNARLNLTIFRGTGPIAWSFSFKYHYQSKNSQIHFVSFQSKDEESFVKQSFLMSFDLHCNGKNSFYFHLLNMSLFY